MNDQRILYIVVLNIVREYTEVSESSEKCA